MSIQPDKEPSLDEILKSFDAAPAVTDADLMRLADANRKLDEDPAFLTEVQEAMVANQLRAALETSGESQVSLAKRWGKTRQYVSKLLSEKLTNYTLETITHAAYYLGLRVSVKVHRPGEVVVVKSAARIAGGYYSSVRPLKPLGLPTTATLSTPSSFECLTLLNYDSPAGDAEKRPLAA
jgi:transcriptional regulator with XRE-family HTH domain